MDIPRLIALTRDVSPGIVRCELTFLPRTEIDFAKASEQHRAYRDALAALGVEVVHLDDGASFPTPRRCWLPFLPTQRECRPRQR